MLNNRWLVFLFVTYFFINFGAVCATDSVDVKAEQTLHIDIPVKLEKANVVFNVDHLAFMYNKVIQIGNLTKDPELRYTPQGTPVANFRVAVTTKHKSGDGYKDQTLFIDVVVFGKQAENCSQYLAKGRRVLVEGRLQERRWESEGQQRSKMEIIADTVRFMPSRKGDGAGTVSQQPEEAPPAESTDLEPF